MYIYICIILCFYKKYNEYMLYHNIKYKKYCQFSNINYNENTNIFDLAVVLTKNYVIIVIIGI